MTDARDSAKQKQRRPSYLLEGCAIDPLADDPQALARLLEAARRGLVKLLVTDLTHQDLAATPDKPRRDLLLHTLEQLAAETAVVPAVLVNPESKRARPTYPGNVVPVGESSSAMLERLKVSQRADARQALAAHWANACLVTNDEGLTKRAAAEGIRVQSNEQFAATIDLLLRAQAQTSGHTLGPTAE